MGKHIRADSPETLLLAYTNYEVDFRCLAIQKMQRLISSVSFAFVP